MLGQLVCYENFFKEQHAWGTQYQDASEGNNFNIVLGTLRNESKKKVEVITLLIMLLNEEENGVKADDKRLSE